MFSGIETINEDLYTISLIKIFILLTMEKFNPDKDIIKIDIKTNVNKENFCLVVFFRKADLIAITKSSLLVAITLNTQ